MIESLKIIDHYRALNKLRVKSRLIAKHTFSMYLARRLCDVLSHNDYYY